MHILFDVFCDLAARLKSDLSIFSLTWLSNVRSAFALDQTLPL